MFSSVISTQEKEKQKKLFGDQTCRTTDGSPCGLLNHFSMPVKLETHPSDASHIPQLLMDLGLIPLDSSLPAGTPLFHVHLNGRVMGYVAESEARGLADRLRMVKVNPSDKRISAYTEIALIPRRKRGQFPGLFIFTGAARYDH